MGRARLWMPAEVAERLQLQIIDDLAEQGGPVIGRRLRFVEPRPEGAGWMLWVGLQTGEAVERLAVSQEPYLFGGILAVPIHSPEAWGAWLGLLTTPGAVRWLRSARPADEGQAGELEEEEGEEP